MLKVISCIQRHTKDGDPYYSVNVVDSESGEVVSGIYSKDPFKSGDTVSGNVSIVWSKSENKNILGVRGLIKV